MDIGSTSWIASALARRAGRGADGDRIGEAIVLIWHDIETALQPIIGRRGVDALYRRSLFLTVPDHPWLAETYDQNCRIPDVASLRPAVAVRSREEATSAGTVLLQTFHDLLGSFIGAALADRILHPVWARTADLSPDPETAP